MNRDKVRGMFLGIAIGDALGVPMETWTAEEIQKRYGRVTTYLRPDGHKWYDGMREGVWSDDTQLSLVVAESLISNKGINMDDMAKRHVEAFKARNLGWGGSTQDAVIKLANGVHWYTSGMSKKPKSGTGNGVAMKIAPLAAYTYFRTGGDYYTTLVQDFTLMTHGTQMAFASALAQIGVIRRCLHNHSTEFIREEFVRDASLCSYPYMFGSNPCSWGVAKSESEKESQDDLVERLEMFREITGWESKKPEEIIQMFGGGTSYVYNSLPFTYAFFLRNPNSIETLFDVVNAGGDTDTNGSMVGALLGALHGTKIFPPHLIDGLWRDDQILYTAERFCEAFNIKE